MSIRITTLLTAVYLILTVCSNILAEEAQAVRILKIHPREHGYSQLKDMVISDTKAFKTHLADVKKQNAWNKKSDYLKVLKNAKVDFDRYKLVIIRHTEGSGSVKVTFKSPQLNGKMLHCEIAREVPDMGTADMAYYAYALTMPKDIEKVELKVPGKKTRIIK